MSAWLSTWRGPLVHVVPLDDLIVHEFNFDCVCGPTPDPDEGKVVIHHSLDGRERDETS